jgi:hypothetical protein
MVRDPHTGKYRRTRLFVLTLGCSRKSVRLLVFRSSARIWAELHEKAFRRLGGATKVVVLDNLKEGVITPDIYDPSLNPLYCDVLAHYGAVALPCRVRDPDRKGNVEAGVAHAQKTPLKGLRFETIEEAQAYLDRWEERWADTRIHGTTKRQVAAMFAEERPSLLPLPIEPFPITSSAREPFISTAASRSKRRITARRPAGSAGVCGCNGTLAMFVLSIRVTVSCCASICGMPVAAAGSKTKTVPRRRRYRPNSSWRGPTGPAPKSAQCAGACIKPTANRQSAKFSGCCLWPRNMGTPPWKTPARPPWRWEQVIIGSSAGIWSVALRRR